MKKVKKYFSFLQLLFISTILYGVFLTGSNLFASTQKNSDRGSLKETILLPTYQTVKLDIFESNIVDDGLNDGPSSWYASGGVLSQISNIWGGNSNALLAEKPGTYAVINKKDWKNYLLSVDMRSPDDGAIGVMFRYTDKNTYYRFSIDNQNSYKRLIKKSKGHVSVLAEENTPININGWLTIKIQLNNDIISVFINDKYIFHSKDNTLRPGKIGLYCWGNENAEFRNVTISSIEYKAPPTQETVAKVKDKSPPKDPDKKKKTQQKSARPPVLKAKKQPPAPPTTRKKSSEPKSTLASNINKSAFSVNLEDFSIVDDGKKNGPSSWTVSSGVLTQSSNIWGSSMTSTDPSQPGTYAIYDKFNKGDYTVYVDFRSGDDDSIGVLFRYQDKNNYYRFSMNKQQNNRRLVKKVDGVVSVLAESADSYKIGEWYAFKASLKKDRIKIHLDNNLIFDVKDNAFSKGKIGMYCWGNENSSFKNIIFESDRPTVPAIAMTDNKKQKNLVLQKTQKPAQKSTSTPKSKQKIIAKSSQKEMNVIKPPSKQNKKDTLKKVETSHKKSPFKKRSSLISKPRITAAPSTAKMPISQAEEELEKTPPPVSQAEIKIKRKIIDKIAILKNGSDLKLENVSIIDEGEKAGPSSWALYGDTLIQTSSIWGGDNTLKNIEKPGTYAIFYSLANLSNYIVSIDFRAHDNEEIGVIFGYQDKNNYYRYSMNKKYKYRRLIKKVKGKVSILSEDTTGYDLNKWYSFEAKIQDNEILIFLNDILIFKAKDHSLVGGHYAPYCWKNPYSEFKNIRIQNLAMQP